MGSRELTATEWERLERDRLDRDDQARRRCGTHERWGIRLTDGTVVAAVYTSEGAAAFWLDYEQQRARRLADHIDPVLRASARRTAGATVVQVTDQHGQPVTP